MRRTTLLLTFLFAMGMMGITPSLSFAACLPESTMAERNSSHENSGGERGNPAKNQIIQDTLSVLFLGNSYTYYNNLPQLVQDLSSAAGKTLLIDSYMPGGYTVSNHLNDPNAINKISQGGWDYIVIQEQSQVPSIDYYRYNDMYPALTDLKQLAQQFNPCANLITFMTWGRRFGGQQCDPPGTYCSPVFADFNHMQDSLTSAYTEISNLLSVQCAPVGVAWQNVLNDTNLVLHTADNSHPAIEGSYLAACAIFSSLWKLPAAGSGFSAGLPTSTAQYFQAMSDSTVFNGANDWNLHVNEPFADFATSFSANNTANFTNMSTISNSRPLNYQWYFGDGNSSNLQDPTHAYPGGGAYTVTLIASSCIFSDTITRVIQVGTAGIMENSQGNVVIYPNPASDQTNLYVDSRLLGSTFLITDHAGKTVDSGKIKAKETSIKLEHLPAGLYLIRIDGMLKNVIKLIKE